MTKRKKNSGNKKSAEPITNTDASTDEAVAEIVINHDDWTAPMTDDSIVTESTSKTDPANDIAANNVTANQSSTSDPTQPPNLPSSSGSGKSKRTVERIIASSSMLIQCELLSYDFELHQSLNRKIEQLEQMEQDNSLDVSDDQFAAITARHLELLNVRMKLLNLKPPIVDNSKQNNQASSSSSPPTSSGGAIRNKPTDTINIETTCVYCHGEHRAENCDCYPTARRSNILLRRKRCFRCLAQLSTFADDHRNCPRRCDRCGRGHHVSLCHRTVEEIEIAKAKKKAKLEQSLSGVEATNVGPASSDHGDSNKSSNNNKSDDGNSENQPNDTIIATATSSSAVQPGNRQRNRFKGNKKRN